MTNAGRPTRLTRGRRGGKSASSFLRKRGKTARKQNKSTKQKSGFIFFTFHHPRKPDGYMLMMTMMIKTKHTIAAHLFQLPKPASQKLYYLQSFQVPFQSVGFNLFAGLTHKMHPSIKHGGHHHSDQHRPLKEQEGLTNSEKHTSFMSCLQMSCTILLAERPLQPHPQLFPFFVWAVSLHSCPCTCDRPMHVAREQPHRLNCSSRLLAVPREALVADLAGTPMSRTRLSLHQPVAFFP